MNDMDQRLTFVLCVEAGALEVQTVWAIESLRRWGGRLAGCEVMAITPRRGLALRRATLEAFERLDVRHVRFPAPHAYGWWGPMNKAAALDYADREGSGDVIVWLDSDVLVIGEPAGLALSNSCDFAASPASTVQDIGTKGDDDHEPYWRRVCEAHGISPESYSWIPANPREGGRMRMYWQSGVFAYRRAAKVGEWLLARSVAQMEAKIASQHSGIYFHEQTALGVVVHLQGLRYEVLPEKYNFAVNKLVADDIDRKEISTVRVVHYFGSAWPDYFERMVDLFRGERDDVAAFLTERGPLRDPGSTPARGWQSVVRRMRSRQAAHFAQGCTVH